MKKTFLFLAAIFATALLSLPAHAADSLPSLDDDDIYLDSVETVVADPFEGWNRAMHSFNDFTLNKVGRPLYKGYSYVTPRFLRQGLKNAFHNLLFPVRFVNNLLQGKPLAAGVEMSRFILNSTAGLGGFINVAENHKTIVPMDDEDFGQTLGVWGLGNGFYIVWPLLGPSTARDTAGMVGDYFLDPLHYIDPWWAGTSLAAFRSFNELDDTLDMYDTLKRNAIEPYSSFRDAYIQYRNARVAK